MSAINLTQLNVWLDVVFTTLYVVVLLGLSGHFVGNILTGRAKRRFGKWEWPHHEGPPIPALPKLLHATHVISMIALAISGLYVRFPGFIPLWEGARTSMRYTHYVFMVIVTINLVWRLWYAFFSARRDYREFAITRQDLVTAPKVILYYIFVKPSKPHLGKYNVMQKMTYTLFAPLLILQAFTGFALLDELRFFGTNLQQVLIGWNLGALVASTSYAGWIMRTTHYVINWLFIILTTIHVYLSVTEDFPAFLNFFGLSFLDREHAEHEEHGEEGHGHAPSPVFGGSGD